jgi:hypothetical protein
VFDTFDWYGRRIAIGLGSFRSRIFVQKKLSNSSRFHLILMIWEVGSGWSQAAVGERARQVRNPGDIVMPGGFRLNVKDAEKLKGLLPK